MKLYLPPVHVKSAIADKMQMGNFMKKITSTAVNSGYTKHSTNTWLSKSFVAHYP